MICDVGQGNFEAIAESKASYLGETFSGLQKKFEDCSMSKSNFICGPK